MVTRVKGLIARGNFEIEMWWKDGTLARAFITSKKGEVCHLQTKEKVMIKDARMLAQLPAADKEWLATTFETMAGKKYEIIAR